MASTTTGVRSGAMEAKPETGHGLPRRLWNRAKGSHNKHDGRMAALTGGAEHPLPQDPARHGPKAGRPAGPGCDPGRDRKARAVIRQAARTCRGQNPETGRIQENKSVRHRGARKALRRQTAAAHRLKCPGDRVFSRAKENSGFLLPAARLGENACAGQIIPGGTPLRALT